MPVNISDQLRQLGYYGTIYEDGSAEANIIFDEQDHVLFQIWSDGRVFHANPGLTLNDLIRQHVLSPLIGQMLAEYLPEFEFAKDGFEFCSDLACHYPIMPRGRHTCIACNASAYGHMSYNNFQDSWVAHKIPEYIAKNLEKCLLLVGAGKLCIFTNRIRSGQPSLYFGWRDATIFYSRTTTFRGSGNNQLLRQFTRIDVETSNDWTWFDWRRADDGMFRFIDKYGALLVQDPLAELSPEISDGLRQSFLNTQWVDSGRDRAFIDMMGWRGRIKAPYTEAFYEASIALYRDICEQTGIYPSIRRNEVLWNYDDLSRHASEINYEPLIEKLLIWGIPAQESRKIFGVESA